MGYYVRALPWKKSDPKWKLQCMILLDLQMPVMNGTTFLCEIQSHEKVNFRKVPAVGS